jgi:hypothetical protein
MTGKETVEIIKVLQTAYPGFYKNADGLKRTVGLWAEMFRDDPLEIVAAAVKALIVSDSQTYPPTIGSVKAEIAKLTAGRQLSECEAWNLVSRALKNSAYSSAEEYAKLPPTVQRVVGGPAQLREWAQIDAAELQTVISSNFQRSYRAAAQEEKTLRAMPPDVRAVFENFGQSLSLEAGTPATDTPALPGVEDNRRRVLQWQAQQQEQQEPEPCERETSERIFERLQAIRATLTPTG